VQRLPEERELPTNLAILAVDRARRDPDLRAMTIGGRALTYGELDRDSDRFAGYLRGAGVKRGDRVALMLPNRFEFAVAYYGALRLGAVIVPLNVLLKRGEIAFFLRDSGAAFLVAWSHCAAEARAGAAEAELESVLVLGDGDDAEALPQVLLGQESGDILEQVEPNQTAVLMYTSGTTGSPKGAQLTHFGLMMTARVCGEMLDVRPDDRVLGTLPFFHVFGQSCILNTAIGRGARVVMMDRFSASESLDLVQEEGVTHLLGVPTMYVEWANDPSLELRDLSALRLAASGGASLPVEVLRSFERGFGCRLLEGYGLSECSGVASFNHLDRPSKPGSIGTQLWGTEMRVIDGDGRPLSVGEVGEIAIRGYNLMSGYHGRPEEASAPGDADGWFRTGDLAEVDQDGFFFIVGRSKELIIRGGYNVYPREIEEVLYRHPAVLDAAVVGVPDAVLGEEVVAVVVAKPEMAADGEELKLHVRDQVAAYKYPRRVVFADALPKGATGKILKREIDVAALPQR
jgi:long-chain acyl-CoA synthetase